LLAGSDGVEQVKLIGGKPTSIGIGWASHNPQHNSIEICHDLFSLHHCLPLAVRRHLAKRTDYDGKNSHYVNGSYPLPTDCGDSNAENYQDPACYYSSPPLFFVHVDRLKCNAQYLWRVAGEKIWRKFKTPACIGKPIAFAVTADLGQTNYSVNTMSNMKERWESGGFDAVLFPGDLSYADGFHPRWDTFGRLAEPLFGSVPTSYTGGNHELQFEAWNAFEHRYPHEFMAHAADSTSGLWYSYDAGLAHVIMLCSYCDFSESSPQAKWLASDLSRISRERTPWLVATWHTPWYTSNKHHTMQEGSAMRAAFEEPLHKAGIDVVFNGHVHAYERTYPVYQESVDHCSGAVHITVGDGGNRECFADYSKTPGHPWFQYNWSASRKFTFGYGRLQIHNSTHAEWEFFGNEKYPKVQDHAWLTRGEARAAQCPSQMAV